MNALRRLAAALGAIALLALVVSGAGTGSSASAAEETPPPSGVSLEVTVVPGTAGAPVPSPTPSVAPARTTTTTEGGTTVVSGPVSSPVLEDDEYSLGGILYVSGLHTEYQPSIDPLAGDLRVSFTVRNVSGSVIDSSARFWVTSPFGAELSAVDPVPVTGLKPDEKVIVASTLTGVGQWTFATAHYTLTPPTTVEGVTLEPMTRDAFVFLPPWFLLGVAGLAGAAYLVLRLLRPGGATLVDTPVAAVRQGSPA